MKPNDTNNNKPDYLKYSWDWFEYHAGQRLLTFRFFLILFGLLSAAYYKAWVDNSTEFALIIAAFGILVSVTFFILDIRNVKLVNIGRDALIAIENSEMFSNAPDNAVKLLNEDKNKIFFLTHTLWLRILIGVSIIMFITATILTLCKLCE